MTIVAKTYQTKIGESIFYRRKFRTNSDLKKYKYFRKSLNHWQFILDMKKVDILKMIMLLLLDALSQDLLLHNISRSRIKENIYLCIHADLDTVCCPISTSLRAGVAKQQEDCH